MVKWYLVLWASLVWLFGFVYRWTVQVFWDVLFNTYWYIRMVMDRTSGKTWREITVKRDMLLEDGSKSFAAFQSTMRAFKYAYDGVVSKAPRCLQVFTMFPTWTCTVRVLVYRDFAGNCQDAAQVACAILRKLKRRKAVTHLEWKKDVYIPLDPSRMDAIHYIVTGSLTEGGETSTFVVSNSSVTKGISADDCAKGILNKGGIYQYIWVSRKPWTVKL